MSIVFNTIRQGTVSIQLKKGSRIIGKTHLTIGQDFDIVLIRALDKILRRNKIDRLSLKSVEISGKMAPGALSGIILRAVVGALRV